MYLRGSKRLALQHPLDLGFFGSQFQNHANSVNGRIAIKARLAVLWYRSSCIVKGRFAYCKPVTVKATK